MDEPTSSLDIHTEAVILDAISRLKRNRTTFIIAHRLETLSDCDIVLAVEGGHVRKITTDDLDAMPTETDGQPMRRRSDRLAAVLTDPIDANNGEVTS